jgi:very-short-patch-repair endonuclease
MPHLPVEVIDHFAQHHGIASRARLVELGLTRDRIIGLQHAGTLVGVLKGVYWIPVVPFNEAARCVAVCAAHDDAVIAGPTAGRLWCLRRLPPDRRIHVIVRPHRQPSIEPWIVPYRTNAIRGEDVIDRADGIRLTTRARTALDLARHLGDVDLLSVIEQVANDDGLDDDDLRDVAVDFVSKQRPWLRRYLLQLDRRLDGGAAASHQETIFGDALHAAGVRPLVRQFPIDLPGYGPARFDLAVPPVRWAIEVDVHPTHRETEGRRRDQRRDASARSMGWDVTRVVEADLGPSITATVERLSSWFDARRAARQR